MNEQSIKKLRRKFIFIALVSISVAMFFVAVLVNITDIFQNDIQMVSLIDLIIENGGTLDRTDDAKLPDAEDPSAKSAGRNANAKNEETTVDSGGRLAGFSPEFRYSTRYFTVIFDKNGDVKQVYDDHISAVNREQIINIASSAVESSLPYGHINGSYFYKYADYEDGKIVVLVDDYQNMNSRARLIALTILILTIGIFLSLVLLMIFSRKLIRPEIDNVNRQKQFITNASHELKTPLAVISANTEVIEAIDGESEWTDAIKRQVERMNALIKNLVSIAKNDEKDSGKIEMTDLSKLAEESAEPFIPLIEGKKLKFEKDIKPDVNIKTDGSKIRQLVGILLDNAAKYCDDGGTVAMKLEKESSKSAKLIVSNSYAKGKDTDTTKFFDRFYREDSSHNQTGGFGIGLSIAQSICENTGGSIKAEYKDGVISFVCVIKQR